MKNSRIIKILFGLFIIYIGVAILLHNLGFDLLNAGSIFPILIVLIGYVFLRKGKHIVGFILLALGILILLDEWFDIQIDEIIGFALALAIIYLGYRLIRTDKNMNNLSEKKTESFVEKEMPSEKFHKEMDVNDHEGVKGSVKTDPIILKTPKKKQSIIGNCIMTGSRWELTDMDIWHGLGGVKLDLSRANIPEQKSTIMINGWIGDVDIYVPYDVEISLISRVGLGDIVIFGNKEAGFNRSTSMETAKYRQSIKRVEIIVNLMMGDIDIVRIETNQID